MCVCVCIQKNKQKKTTSVWHRNKNLVIAFIQNGYLSFYIDFARIVNPFFFSSFSGHTVLCESAAAKEALQLHINFMLYMLSNQTSPKVSFLIKKEGRALESLPTTLQLHLSKLKFALSKTISLYRDEYFEIVSDISEPASVPKKTNSQIILVKDQFPPITTEVMPITKTSSAASHFQGGILNVISRFVSDCLYFPLRNYFFLPFLEIPVRQLGVLIII